MADISSYLAAIMAAVKGEEVRGSIHDAIDVINKAQEVALGSGTAINDGDPKTSQYYEGSLYINTATDQLLRCGSADWQLIGSIRGNGISSISGPVTTGLDDVYTIHYDDGNNTVFTVHNGRGIVSIALYDQTGLVDTYRVTYNDSTYYDFSIKNGNQWYYGIAITGGSSVAAPFVLPYEVKSGDAYLNINTDEVYACTVGATAGATSMWEYKMTISSSSTGTNNYAMLSNHPYINGNELTSGALVGHDLGLLDEDKADAWLMDTSATPVAPMKKQMAIDSTSVTFTALEMADIYSHNWAVKAFFNVADGQPAPTFKKMVKDAVTGNLTIYYSKVKEAQAGGPGGTQCWCQLRIVK